MKKNPIKYIRTFDRYELKYFIHYTQEEEFLDQISPYVFPDPHMDQLGFYKVISLYYDSPALTFYWEKIDGEALRRKLRIRIYGHKSKDAFLEIKQRIKNSVQKRRCRAPLIVINDQIEKMLLNEYKQGYDPVFDEAFILIRKYNLGPKLIVSYNRTAYFNPYKNDLRITIDKNIKCRNLDLNLTSSTKHGCYAIPPTYAILEIKFNSTIPSWICSVLNKLNLQYQKVSKYCLGIESLEMQMLLKERRNIYEKAKNLQINLHNFSFFSKPKKPSKISPSGDHEIVAQHF